ncbi:MAG TPA: hypothetical protein VF160_13325 [Candidatus Dormibacteraeota bacterium]
MSDAERDLLRWGGVAGVLTAVFLVLTAVTLFGFVRLPADPRALVEKYPDFRTAYAVGETFTLISAVFAVAFYLALYRALRSSLAPALWGTGLSLLGLAVLAVEGTPRIAYGHISDLYHGAAASPQDQATLALIWQTTQAMFTEFDTAATILLTTGYILLGVAMLRNPAFGRTFGVVTAVLGLAGVVGVYLLGVSSLLFAPLGLFVLIVLPLLLGLKIYRLAGATSELRSP